MPAAWMGRQHAMSGALGPWAAAGALLAVHAYTAAAGGTARPHPVLPGIALPARGKPGAPNSLTPDCAAATEAMAAAGQPRRATPVPPPATDAAAARPSSLCLLACAGAYKYIEASGSIGGCHGHAALGLDSR